MMQTPRGKAFEEHEPKLSSEEIQREIDAQRGVVSLKGLPVLTSSGLIQFLAVKFALSDGAFSTVLLDRLDAAALKTLIDAADKVNWDGNALKTGPVQR